MLIEGARILEGVPITTMPLLDYGAYRQVGRSVGRSDGRTDGRTDASVRSSVSRSGLKTLKRGALVNLSLQWVV
jgi:hypothetical protein